MWAKIKGLWDKQAKMKHIFVFALLAVGVSQAATRVYPPPFDFDPSEVIESNQLLRESVDELVKKLDNIRFSQSQEQNVFPPASDSLMKQMLREQMYAEWEKSVDDRLRATAN